jgi:hypothetical protein
MAEDCLVWLTHTNVARCHGVMEKADDMGVALANPAPMDLVRIGEEHTHGAICCRYEANGAAIFPEAIAVNAFELLEGEVEVGLVEEAAEELLGSAPALGEAHLVVEAQ